MSESQICFRQDIQWSPFAGSKNNLWVALDPIRVEFFYLSDLEYRIAKYLDGSRSLEEILDLERGVSREWLSLLILKFENSCLLASSQLQASGARLDRVAAYLTRRRKLQSWLSPLAIRWKLFDPSPLLDRSHWFGRIMFSYSLAGVLGLVGAIVGFLVLNKLLSQPLNVLESMQNLTPLQTAMGMLLFLVVKSIHEAGHALACRRWGADCREVGVMFLVFAPYLYCDTTQSWKVPSAWKRAAIAAAGIYFESALAILGAIGWLIALPETSLSVFSAYLFVICSVSTVLVNANPLLRYDGYYVLSDLWGVPNLHQQSRSALETVLHSWFLGRKSTETSFDGNVWLLSAYCVASWFYRLFLTVVILYFVWNLFEYFGVSLLGLVIVALVSSTTLFNNLSMLVRFVGKLVALGRPNLFRLSGVFLLFLVASTLVSQAEISTLIVARAWLQPYPRTPVFAPHDGTLAETIVSDSNSVIHVSAGQQIFRIDSRALEKELVDSRSQLKLLKHQREQMERLSIEDESVTIKSAELAQDIFNAEERLNNVEEKVDSLSVVASSDGRLEQFFFSRKECFSQRPGQGPVRSSIDHSCIGSRIQRGQQLAWLSGDETRVSAYVSEADVELIFEGMDVRCKLDCMPDRILQGKVVRIASDATSDLPRAMWGDPAIPMTKDGTGGFSTLAAQHHVQIVLTQKPPVNTLNSRATVHLSVAARTPWKIAERWLKQSLIPIFW